jgi:hypothetical protein
MAYCAGGSAFHQTKRSALTHPFRELKEAPAANRAGRAGDGDSQNPRGAFAGGVPSSGMARRPSKRDDANRLAAGIMAQVTGDPIPRGDDPKTITKEKTALQKRAASILGKLGGRGGKAEARDFTPEKRRQIAQNAAVAKWKPKEE